MRVSWSEGGRRRCMSWATTVLASPAMPWHGAHASVNLPRPRSRRGRVMGSGRAVRSWPVGVGRAGEGGEVVAGGAGAGAHARAGELLAGDHAGRQRAHRALIGEQIGLT